MAPFSKSILWFSVKQSLFHIDSSLALDTKNKTETRTNINKNEPHYTTCTGGKYVTPPIFAPLSSLEKRSGFDKIKSKSFNELCLQFYVA